MYQKLTQRTQTDTRPQTTAHLAQTMTMLHMSIDELEGEIQKNLSTNPALDVDEVKKCLRCGATLTVGHFCNKCLKDQLKENKELLTFVSTRTKKERSNLDPDDTFFEDRTVDLQTLPEYILRQIGMELSDTGKQIAVHILTQLDENGFVEFDVLELASYYHVRISDIEKVKSLIQHANPIGTGSENAQEAMLVQIEELKKRKNVPPKVGEIIQNHYKDLLRKQYREIGEKLGISADSVKRTAQFIAENLNPFPAQSNWGDVRNPQENDLVRYSSPDVIISYLENDPEKPLVLEVLLPANSNLFINSSYQKAIKEVDKETKEKMRTDMEKANLFIKCIQQRRNTILRMMETIIQQQEEFIRNGERFMKPITRAQIAEKLQVHESTISRAVAGKTVQLPNNTIKPIAIFFDRSLYIRTEIKGLIANEDKPLSDMQISRELEKQDIHIARRTVAKYRDMEGILPAYQRKEKK